MSDEERALLVDALTREAAETLLEQLRIQVVMGLRPPDLDLKVAEYACSQLMRKGIEHCRLN
ncbi:hypothetical protein KSB_39630 [Ktedonobacter robiniae]|uniref:Uncharacterized protein n=1 Tax=Ktedonobacter robiniae TaxID=2778365 RepID=A0ABQ3US08_9CHLR|nr:hypothetical protein KSB_39630 [Ktedonobacter robiniae]